MGALKVSWCTVALEIACFNATLKATKDNGRHIPDGSGSVSDLDFVLILPDDVTLHCGLIQPPPCPLREQEVTA